MLHNSTAKKLALCGQWLSFLVIPPMLFPVFWLFAAIFDWLFGDSAMVLRLQYDSKAELFREFIGDWVASLPFSIITVWLIMLPVCVLSARQECRIGRYPLLLGGLIGLLAGFWLYHFEILGVLFMGIVGCCIGSGVLIMKWLSVRFGAQS